MSKRVYCDRCYYPQTVCVCHAILRIETSINVILLQHPNETKHAKNSARLIPLCLANSQILVGEHAQDFQLLKQEVALEPWRYAVVYPSTSSIALEDNLRPCKQSPVDRLIFIDATWRKAYKMWQLNPWLAQCTQWHFSNPPESQYDIRKTSVSNALSTLEAVAYVLKTRFEIDDAPLMKLFAAMQAGQQRHRNPK